MRSYHVALYNMSPLLPVCLWGCKTGLKSMLSFNFQDLNNYSEHYLLAAWMDFFTTNPNETTSNPIRFFSPDITNLTCMGYCCNNAGVDHYIHWWCMHVHALEYGNPSSRSQNNQCFQDISAWLHRLLFFVLSSCLERTDLVWLSEEGLAN